MKTKNNWYALQAGQVIDYLNSNEKEGLSSKEVENRQHQYGLNILPQQKKQPLIIRFLKHFNDILIYILFIAAVISALLGHYIDTIVILAVAVVNALIGFMQENKAEKALEDIKQLLSHRAHVIRGEKRKEVDANQLTIGDIVLLAPGDKVPADLRLLETNNLQIEESALTGESVPSEKSPAELPEDTMLGDRINMAFSSTTVSSGTGVGIVVAIGKDTEIGKINQMISDIKPVTTPLLKQTAKFGKSVSIVIVVVAILIYVFGYFFRHYDPTVLLMSVIGLAVAAIPEGLPAILSIILAIGVQNMAKRKAIIRTLPSVETLGSVSVICSDKTGTLTRNEMTVRTLMTRDDRFKVSGIGYAPDGKITHSGKPVDFAKEPVLAHLIDCYYYCNDAHLGKNKEGIYSIKGDPTEGSLLTLYKKADVEKKGLTRLATIPFDSTYKYMAVLLEGDEKNILFVKGAPDRLLNMTSKEEHNFGLKKLDKDFWKNEIEEIAGKGQRMIGGAYKYVEKTKQDLDHDDLQSGLIFLGLAGIIDPPREEAIEAITACKDAGITVKMITGDHVATAKAIGKEMGIGDGTRALQGKDLAKMDESQIEKAVIDYNIFARTSPEDKLKLVEGLQANDIICAMTGDGVNDAPALKKADVGIAMGIKGTEVTKDSAEMVLADDNFTTIISAVEEGRRVYDNLKKTILFVLPTNGAESFLIMASILFGTMIPLIPVQILWVNMVTSVTISLALAFEKIEPDAMKRPPRPSNSSLLSGYYIWRIIFVSLIIGGGTLIMNMNLLDNGVSELVVKTITLNALVIAQMFYLFNSRSVTRFAFGRDFFSNRMVFIVSGLLILLQLAITYFPFMNSAFSTTPLALHDWIYPIGIGLMVFVLVEIEKAVMNKLGLAKL